MKKRYYIVLCIILLLILSSLATYSLSNKNEPDSVAQEHLTPFEQLKTNLNKELEDLGEATIIFVHFEDVNLATLEIKNDKKNFPLTITNSESNSFKLPDVPNSPDNLTIGESFGLAKDNENIFYYYSLDD